MKYILKSTLLFVQIVSLSCMLLACSKEDVGMCTIIKSGGNVTHKDVTIEECQDRFLHTPGASGWKWDPND